MNMRAAIILALASTAIFAHPGQADEDAKKVERKCEIRIENGKETRKGDCDGVDANNMQFGDGDGKQVRIEIQTDTDGDGPHKMMWVGHGGMDMDFDVSPGNEFVTVIGDMNQDWDSDGDGKVSKEEIRAAKQKELAKYDRNRDGKLSLDEYKQLWIAKHNSQMVDDFQALDEDGDAKVTLDEFSAGGGKHVFIRKMITKHKEVHKDEK